MPHGGTIDRNLIAVQLYNDLLSGIQVGDYPPHKPLPTEASLAHDYGVSRSIVRSALSVLKEDGVVVSRQGSGTIVAPPENTNHDNQSVEINTEELKDCYKCRESMEPDIAAYAAQNRTERHVRYLEQQLKIIRKELSIGVVHTGNDADFHVHLAKMSGNRFFETIIKSLRPHILIGMNLAKSLPPTDRKDHNLQSLFEHRAIATAIVEGDCDGARSAMTEHLVRGQDRIFA